MNRISTAGLFGIFAALAAPPAVYSQDALEEIVVTAQKREQNLQDVGIAITAFSGSELLDRGIDEIVQIQEMAPNLTASESSLGNGSVPRFVIRGVGSQTERSAVSSSPVGVHVNEIAAAYPVTTTNLLFDIERVEVLRGPQGDLFGLNTTGGTINFVTNKPTDEFDASVLVEAGQYERFKVEGFVSGPLTENLAARLSVSHNDRNEGPQFNADPAVNRDYGRFAKTGTRLSLRYTPTDRLTADFELHATKTEDEPMTVRLIDLWPLNGLTNNPEPEVMQDYWGVRFNIDPAISPGHGIPGTDNDGNGGSLKIEYDFGNMVLTSLTGYEDYHRREYDDNDGSVAQDSYRVYWSDLWSVSQEFRLSGSNETGLNWMVGANVAKDHLNQKTIFDEPDNPDFPGVGGQAPIQDRDMKAVFGHAEYELNDKWVLTGGLRYTNEKRTEHNIGTFLWLDPTGQFGGDTIWDLTPDLSRLLPGGLLTDHCFITEFREPCSLDPQPLTDQLNAKEWSGRIGANYFLNEDVMIYSSLSRGFKAGGFNDVASATSLSYVPTKPEFLNAFEIGVKSTLMDGRMRINVSGFWYDYEDQQVGASIYTDAYGPLGALGNAPESTVRGGEIEMMFSPTDYFTFVQNFGYTLATFEKFQELNGGAIRRYREDCNISTGTTCAWTENPDPTAPWYNEILHGPKLLDRAGERFGGPRWNISGSATFRTDIGADFELSATVDYNYAEETTTNARAEADGSFRTLSAPNLLPADIPFFTLSDGTIALRGGYERLFINGRIELAKGDVWTVGVFGRNLADERIYGSGGSFNQAVSMRPVEPRTWGVRLRYNF